MRKNAKRRTLRDRYLRARSNRRHIKRLLFVSPAETKFVRVMGGCAIVIPFIYVRGIYGPQPLTLLFRGITLWWYQVEHEVRIGRYFADFSTSKGGRLKVIEIDGRHHQLDVVADQRREDYLHEWGAYIYRINGVRLWREPRKVRKDVMRFLRA